MDTKPTLRDLFVAFAKAGLQSFGGAMQQVQSVAVEEKKWISEADFNEIVGACQFVPGPNATNATLCIGTKLRGSAGGIVAALGLLTGPAIFVCLVAAFFDRFNEAPMIQSVAEGMAAAGAGILVAMALKQAKSLKNKGVWLPVAFAVAIAVAGFKLPAMMVLAVGLVIGFGLAKQKVGETSK